MIHYDNSGWVLPVFTWIGTVWPAIRNPMLTIAIYVGVSYFFAVHFDIVLGQSGPICSVIGGTLSFLLIFRANSAYMRYWNGRTSVSIFFTSIRDFLMLSLLYLHGTREKEMLRNPQQLRKLEQIVPDVCERASKTRVDFVRLCIAYAVILKMHTRIAYEGYCFGQISGETKWLVDWDRLRLIQLLSEDEFEKIDKCIGIVDVTGASGSSLDELIAQFQGNHKPPSTWPEVFEVKMDPACRPNNVIMFFIREALFNCVNDAVNSCPWGIKERFASPLSKLLQSAQREFESINQIITTPLPLPYACLCKSLLVIFLASLPSMLIDVEVGAFGSLFIPMMVALALLGIDATATELENPFGDDANDLDLMEFVAGLEHEALQIMRMCGDFDGRSKFEERTMPWFVSATSCKPLSSQLVVEKFASSVDVGESMGESEEGSLLSGSRLESQRSSLPSAREDDL